LYKKITARWLNVNRPGTENREKYLF